MAVESRPLEGKVAIVTGSSRGIGRDMAMVLAQAGAAVVVAARTEQVWDTRLPGTIYEVAEQIRSFGGRALPVKTDVTKDEDLENLVQRTLEEFGRLDILVNNAAILIPGDLQSVQVRHIDLIWRVNLRGPIMLMKLAVEPMIQGGGGHIINASSVGALMPGPGPYPEDRRVGGSFYGMTKRALERFSQGAAMELAQYNIAVNVLSPRGGYRTPGNQMMRLPPGAAPDPSQLDSAVNMGRAAVWICCQDPKQFTGHILYDRDLLQEHGLPVEETRGLSAFGS